MITRRADGGIVLMDREDLAAWLRRPIATIRAHCTPIAYDPATNHATYEAEACRKQLSQVKRRFRVASR